MEHMASAGTKDLLKGSKAEAMAGSLWLHTAWGLPTARAPGPAPSTLSHSPTGPLPLWSSCPLPWPSQVSRPPDTLPGTPQVSGSDVPPASPDSVSPKTLTANYVQGSHDRCVPTSW